MCVQNVNATISLFRDVRRAEVQGAQEFMLPFDTIISNSFNNNRYIGGFFIVIDIALLSTTNEEKKKTNVIYNKEKINILIRMTKSSKDKEKQLSLDIDDFTIDASQRDLIKTNACVEYINYKRIKKIDVNAIQLTPEVGIGDYIFKVLVKRPYDKNFQVQSIYGLKVE